MILRRSEYVQYYFYATGLLVVIIGLIWGANAWSSFRNYDTLTEIHFSRTKVLPVETYSELVGDFLSIPLGDIESGEVRERLMENPFVWASRVSRKFPSSLNIEIAERIPLGLVNKNVPVLIDLMGVVLPYDSNVHIDMIPALSNFNNSDELYPVGKPVLSVKVIDARNILYGIWRNYHSLYQNLSEIRLNIEDEFELILANRPTKIILGTDGIEYKLLVLKEFEKTLQRKRLTDYRVIDLRYMNQVVIREWRV